MPIKCTIFLKVHDVFQLMITFFMDHLGPNKDPLFLRVVEQESSNLILEGSCRVYLQLVSTHLPGSLKYT